MKHLEEAESLQFAKACAGMDVWQGCIAVVVKVYRGFLEAMQLLKTGLRYLLTGKWGPAQTGCNDFEHEQNGNPSDFLLVWNWKQ